MKEYHKIETLFERDLATKKLVIGKYRNSTGEWVKKDEATGEMLELTEKDKAITGMIDVLESANLPRMITNVDIAIPLCEAGYRKQDEAFSRPHENGGEWISVEERLPEENGRYLVFVDISHLAFTSLTIIAVMEYGKSHGFYLYNETEKVTHWMPLPEPPKKGGRE